MKKSFILLCLVYIFASCDDGGLDLSHYSPEDDSSETIQTANDIVPQYENHQFIFGMNTGYKNHDWKDTDVADIILGNMSKGIIGLGANGLRPALYENFVEKYGYNIRVNEFDYYTQKGSINTAFIGDRPSDIHRERKTYTTEGPSESYENLYTPIWKDGAINTDNYFAYYVYRVAQLYGKNIKYWEIKNEPDFTYTQNVNRASGDGNNWWDKDPDPSDLKNLRAPIQSYIRMLRISYEVIKKQYPDACVCIGGIGYLSFLDAVLRNTDNPDKGKVTTQYPLKGGAWFDCLSFHSYPMYQQRKWVGYDGENNINGFLYTRNSDNAASIVASTKKNIESLLRKYGYGNEYPQKRFLITEVNIPNKAVDDKIGSQEAQRNFALKMYVKSIENGIDGVYIYGPWDNKEVGDASGGSFDYMGAYKPIPDAPGGKLRENELGIAWRTLSNICKNYTYDPAVTSQLNLPSNIKGVAMKQNADFIYILWGETTKDMSEAASIQYTFPDNFKISTLYCKKWNEEISQINSNKIELTGTPIFIKTNKAFQ